MAALRRPPRRPDPPVGLDWIGNFEDLDAAFSAAGAVRRDLPPIVTVDDQTLRDYFQELGERKYSWTWRIPPEELEPAVAEVRTWAEREHPDFDSRSTATRRSAGARTTSGSSAHSST